MDIDKSLTIAGAPKTQFHDSKGPSPTTYFIDPRRVNPEYPEGGLFDDETATINNRNELKTPVPKPEPAIGFLEEARKAMEDRAKLRDTPQGERTAKKIAAVFNALTGHDLTESDAWTFLIVMKLVRAQTGKYNRDDYVDLSAYSSLKGECESTK
jgi:hypothetical protein